MKILVIESSPHKKGSSNLLAEHFIREAKEAGHAVLHPCLECETGDVAKLLGVNPMTVINYDKQGKLKFERTATQRRVISKENLIRYLIGVDLFVDDEKKVKRKLCMPEYLQKKTGEKG